MVKVTKCTNHGEGNVHCGIARPTFLSPVQGVECQVACIVHDTTFITRIELRAFSLLQRPDNSLDILSAAPTTSPNRAICQFQQPLDP